MDGIAAAFVAMELVCVALSWLVALRMRTEVNERLAREERISVWMIHGAYWRMARLTKNSIQPVACTLLSGCV